MQEEEAKLQSQLQDARKGLKEAEQREADRVEAVEVEETMVEAGRAVPTGTVDLLTTTLSLGRIGPISAAAASRTSSRAATAPSTSPSR